MEPVGIGIIGCGNIGAAYLLFLPKGGEWGEIAVSEPFADGNHRSLGLADMAAAIRRDRPHRASGALALHVLEVMEGFARSAETGRAVAIETRPERPAPLNADPALVHAPEEASS